MAIKGGIYKIINLVNNKVYIGSAVNLKKRKASHLHALKNNCHGNDHLQKAYNKYKKENFLFKEIEAVEKKEELINREQYYLDTVLFASDKSKRFYNLGYNICRRAGSRLGSKWSETSRKKMRKPKNKEHKEKIAKIHAKRKNKTYEQVYGNSLAKEIKKKQSIGSEQRQARIVIQKDLNENLINEFSSMKQAHLVMNIPIGCGRIAISIKNNKPYKKFIWSYKN